MDLQTRMGDDGVSVTVAEAMTDCDELFGDRNTLAVALRKIIDGDGTPPHLWEIDDARDVAESALLAVFPDDPLGRRPLYDCPDAHGRNRLREELDAD